MTYTPYEPVDGPVPPEGPGGGSPRDKKRQEIRENRIAALAFVGEVFSGKGDVSRYQLDAKYAWAMKVLGEQ